MSNKGIYATIIVKNIEKSMVFYTEEMNFFVKNRDFGMGNIRLTYCKNDLFGFFLQEDKNYEPPPHPILTIYTNNIKEEYDRFKNLSFNSGGYLLSKNGLFEYPAGESFTLIDPSGNKIIIEKEF